MAKPYLGKVHIYTGDGHGKTTASLGISLRAIGHNLKVIVIQFMKGRKNTGEFLIQKRLKPNFFIYQFGSENFVYKNKISKEDSKIAKDGLNFAKNILRDEKPDILILDEINVALYFKLLKVGDLIDFIDNFRDKGTEIILTGRNADERLIKAADLVTEMKKIKHYYNSGLQAREGIEY